MADSVERSNQRAAVRMRGRMCLSWQLSFFRCQFLEAAAFLRNGKAVHQMILIKGIYGKVNLLYVFFREMQDGVFQFFQIHILVRMY